MKTSFIVILMMSQKKTSLVLSYFMLQVIARTKGKKSEFNVHFSNQKK